MSTDDLYDPWITPDEMEPEEQAVAVARAAVLVSSLVLLGYVIQLVPSFLVGRETSIIDVIGDVISLGLSALLLRRIWTRQALWAALLVGVFFGAEFVGQLGSFLNGEPTGGLVIMFATLALCAVVSAFGAWRFAALRDPEA